MESQKVTGDSQNKEIINHSSEFIVLQTQLAFSTASRNKQVNFDP